MRRATLFGIRVIPHIVISIHALHEESDLRLTHHAGCIRISIHALHEESDQHAVRTFDLIAAISIHALHEESDLGSLSDGIQILDFNPRSP